MAARRASRALLILALVACSTREPVASIDADRTFAHVRALTDIGPRPRDSDGSRAAAGYIEDELARLGVDIKRMAVGTIDLPQLAVLGRVVRPAQRVQTTDPNIVVRFGPAGKALLLMAHYDTVTVSPGAVDNAAAVAVLLELARSMAERAPAQPVQLVFTANEEIGLVGAEAFAARHGHEVAFAIALDLIGGDGELTLNGASKLIGAAELRWLAGAADRAGASLSVPLAHRAISRRWPEAERSDHGAFTRRGIRGVHLYNRGNDGEWIDLAYHSNADTPARIARASLVELGALLRVLVDAPVPAHAGDGFWLPYGNVVPRWLLVAGELALLVVVIVMLGFSREGAVAWIARARTRAIAARDVVARPRAPALFIGAVCFAIAIAVAYLVERAVAGGHPAPWLHAPLYSLIATACVLVGSFGLLTRAIARMRSWSGAHRYLVVAASTCVLIGGVLLALDAAELAWVWLVPAFVIAIAPQLGRASVLAIIVAALPIACVLHPLRVREASWNGFLPLSLPLAVSLGLLAIPHVATIAWWLRRRRPAGPLGTLVLGVGCGLAVVVGVLLAVAYDPVCTAPKFESFHLACERV